MDNDRGQSLITKYVWVIETIYRRRKISFKELNELWLRDDISRGVDIPKRTFDNWRYVIWDMFGISIVNENRGDYRYYIENEEDISKNGLRSWLYNTFCVSNALANSQSIKERIILEYVPSGQNYLQPIIEAMKENHVLNMTYHSYWKDEENNFDVQPYCVKLFRQRWYIMEHQGCGEQGGQLIEEIECYEVRRQHRTEKHAFREEEETVVTALCPAVGHVDGGVGDREEPAHRNEYRHRRPESVECEGEGEGLGHVPHGALRAPHLNGGEDRQRRNDGLHCQQGHFRLGDGLLFYKGTARTQQQGEQNQHI